MKHKKNFLKLLIGIGSMVLGYTYAHELYGVLESEVQQWGYLSEILGVVLFLLVLKSTHGRFMSVILYLCLGIQIPPIILWFIFHGSRITDAPPTMNDQFIAHWAFSIPHIILLTLCFCVLYQNSWLSNSRKSQ